MGLRTGPTQPVEIEGQGPRSFSQAEIDAFEQGAGVPANFVTPGGQVAFTSDKSRRVDINPLADLAGAIDTGLNVPADTGPATFQEEDIFSPPAPAVEDVGPIDAVPDTSMNLTSPNLEDIPSGTPVSEAQTSEEIQKEEEAARLQNDVKEGVKAAEAQNPEEAGFIDRLFANPEVIAALSSLALIPLGGELGARLGFGRAGGELIGASAIATGAQAGLAEQNRQAAAQQKARKRAGVVKDIQYVDPDTGDLRSGTFDPQEQPGKQYKDMQGKPLSDTTIPFVRPFEVTDANGNRALYNPSTNTIQPIPGLGQFSSQAAGQFVGTPSAPGQATFEDLTGTDIVATDEELKGVSRGQLDRLRTLMSRGESDKAAQAQEKALRGAINNKINVNRKAKEQRAKDQAAKDLAKTKAGLKPKKAEKPDAEPPKGKTAKELSFIEKQMAGKLTTDLGGLKKVANVLEAEMTAWDEAKTNDDKISIGRNMVKALNSTFGADAVGVEEGKRLGKFLEFNIANITEPGPFFGRDLNLFRNQVRAKIKTVKQAANRTRQELDRIDPNALPVIFVRNKIDFEILDIGEEFETFSGKYRKTSPTDMKRIRGK